MTEHTINPQLQLASDFLHYTNKNIFLTGKAGTGKTTFLKNLRKTTPKRMIVVAPTGVAAINAGGVTIHSFFQLNFGPQIPNTGNESDFRNARPDATNPYPEIKRFSKIKINIIRSLDLLVIDEISMVRADILDGIDGVLRRYKNRYKPFGGVQLLMIGDLQQLAPVVKEDEWEILKKFYDTAYFFSSNALKQSEFIGIELKHIYRQSDQEFIDLLNKVRDNLLDRRDLMKLNSRFIPGFSPADDEGYITLTTHNYQSLKINEEKLEKLLSKKHKFTCSVVGEFPEFAFPADEVLILKLGAQVMFIKNDSSPEKQFYNGKIGKIVEIDEDGIEVFCTGDELPIKVTPETWENKKYNLNEQSLEIEEETIGKFTQYPLKLAWAITIHKSQGLTFERAIIDARQSFAHGQVYVALSRCKTLEGMVLSSPIGTDSVISDPKVLGFTDNVEKNQPDEKALEKSRRDFEYQLIAELFNYKPISGIGQSLIKFWIENDSVLFGSLKSILSDIINKVNQEFTPVSEKFLVQAGNLLNQFGFIEKNPQLQDRLKKAVEWFSEKTGEFILNPLDKSGFETDNKAIRKRLSEILARIETELEIKVSCFASLLQGFTVESFLEARALAQIEKPSSSPKSKETSVNVKNPDFYQQLKKWRKQQSEETGLEETRVLPQKAMVEIADKLPVSVSSLKAIKKMGGERMAHFGREILALILEYRHKKGMEIPKNVNDEIAIAGLNTKEISLKMFKDGKTAVQIAKARTLAISTIESHLFHFISTGEIEIHELIDPERYELIRKHIDNNPEIKSITELKNLLGDKYSYNEIRLVLSTL